MAARFSVHRVVELIDKYLDEEDYPESDNNEIDRQHIYCDFLDENGQEVYSTALFKAWPDPRVLEGQENYTY